MCQGVSKTTLRFGDLLEVFTELRRAVILMPMVYYRERIQIKISREKRLVNWGLGETRHELPLSPPSGVTRLRK